MVVFIIIGAVIASAFTAQLSKPYLISVFFLVIFMMIKKVIKRRGVFPRRQGKLLLASFMVIGVYMSCIYAGSPQGPESVPIEYLSIFIKLSIGPLLLIVLPLIYENKAMIVIDRVLFAFMACDVALIVFQLQSGVETGSVIGSLHSNYMGLVGFLTIITTLLCVQLHGSWKRLYRLTIILSVAVIILALSRGSAVSAVAFLATLYMWNKGLIGRKSARIYMPMVLLGLMLISVSFSQWVESESAQTLNDISESITGKSLDTGRSKLWSVAYNGFEESPIYGLGTGARKRWDRVQSDGSIITLSVHNYYLAVLVEAGVVGFTVVLLLLYYVLHLMISNPTISNIGFSALIAILIHQMNEVSLTTGTFTAGVLIWTTLSMVVVSGISGRMQGDKQKVALAEDQNYK